LITHNRPLFSVTYKFIGFGRGFAYSNGVDQGTEAFVGGTIEEMPPRLSGPAKKFKRFPRGSLKK
jgi:hypothetical protein